jgi:hypothetical protein
MLMCSAAAFAGQAPGAASDADIPVSHHDRVYAAEQFSNTVSVSDPVDHRSRRLFYRVRSNAIVIGRIVFQNLAQMFLAQDNDVVRTLAPDRSDRPFGKAILPRRSCCDRLVPDLVCAENLIRVDGVMESPKLAE